MSYINSKIHLVFVLIRAIDTQMLHIQMSICYAFYFPKNAMSVQILRQTLILQCDVDSPSQRGGTGWVFVTGQENMMPVPVCLLSLGHKR